MFEKIFSVVAGLGKSVFSAIQFLDGADPSSKLEVKKQRKNEELVVEPEYRSRENQAQRIEFLSALRNSPYSQAMVDFMTSPLIGRMTMIGSVISLGITGASPVLIGSMAIATFGAIATSVTFDAYKRMRLATLQKEDKMLGYIMAEHEEKQKHLDQLEEKADNIKDPTLKQELLKLIDAQSERISPLNPAKEEAYLGSAFLKFILGKLPESAPGFVASIFSFNPITISIASLATALSSANDLNRFASYEDHKVSLMNDMNLIKARLGLTYDRYQGALTLRAERNRLYNENEALKELLTKTGQNLVDEGFKAEKFKQEMANRKEELPEKSFDAATRQQQKRDKTKVNVTLREGAQNYFYHMGKTLIASASAQTSLVMGAPEARHEEFTTSKAWLDRIDNQAIERKAEIAPTLEALGINAEEKMAQVAPTPEHPGPNFAASVETQRVKIQETSLTPEDIKARQEIAKGETIGKT